MSLFGTEAMGCPVSCMKSSRQGAPVLTAYRTELELTSCSATVAHRHPELLLAIILLFVSELPSGIRRIDGAAVGTSEEEWKSYT